MNDGWHASGHNGVDFAGKTAGAADGMKIPAVMGGKVINVFKNNKTAGNAIVVQGADGRVYQYNHMKNAPSYKVGDTIKQGQVLGLIGSTGRSSGPHLDLKISQGGKYVDPLKVIKSIQDASLKKNSGGVPVGNLKDINSEPVSSKGKASFPSSWKLNQATKAPGYQTYKSHLNEALKSGKIPADWVVDLTELVGRESTWNPSAKNPNSTAHGYGQFLKSTRADYEKKTGLNYNNPVHQIIMMAQYVKDRYGTPEKALAFWDKNNYY
ncbi:aggregation-promoting factor C-terminal-like domain-containing protein [Peribacillus saganii]|uniref:aggregation-promoting factor C-terminal-like domain-containing protein n=1 Tax=Peribacillus saganii TaxID=2303992 RepID=UPI00227802BC|nr:peptidoglycan DD-metalloendopeptidase family protein [Peribacillus saganii]